MSFSDNLATLPAIDHIEALELLDAGGNVVATVPNLPGKAGSVKVYNALFAKHGSINPAAAQEGLEIFAEHTEDAKKNPGAHPNIDRLFAIIQDQSTLQVKVITKA